MNDDELISRRKKQNADRVRAYRRRKKILVPCRVLAPFKVQYPHHGDCGRSLYRVSPPRVTPRRSDCGGIAGEGASASEQSREKQK
ncbi:hypothetical protein EVAR_31138_1 [Eumeta japonica]|uniref:BZIP domain-containing protein n=1 Tax=Eumeta variegata TaxID=151549 RepID=A0A4C1VFZ1_EUMVA|nr:hypothetical protein EVAR_31138_1 [Eumeta japonica]